MEFGVFVATRFDDWQLIQSAEELGYDRAWVPDSQMIWSEWAQRRRMILGSII